MARITLMMIACGVLSVLVKPAGGAETELFAQAQAAAGRGASADAVDLATKALELNPQFAAAYYLRGREHFRLGKIQESVTDFDRYVELRPRAAPQQWERGIAYYYAGLHKKGADQFELYQTFHDNDVENSVWRFLCMVPKAGIEKARSVMLPIKNDRRPGMMQVYDLYRGKLQPEQVLAAVGAGSDQQLASRQFYIHLYLGLYYESLGKKGEAEKYLRKAAARKLANNPGINRYMWDVARVHVQRVYDKAKSSSEKSN